MKRISFFCLILAATVFCMLSSCKKMYEMIDAPTGVSGTSASVGWFVKTDGTGDGTSWDDAMSPKSFRTKLYSGSFPSGSEIFLAAGIYPVGESASDYLSVTTGITLRGGYSPDSKGYSTAISYPSPYETVISGDINGNGVADTGDARLMEITSTVPAVFYGISFMHGYIDAPEVDERSGVFIRTGAHAKFHWCAFKDNYCATTATGTAGGAAIAILGGRADLDDCILRGNLSQSRGGAIRILKDETSTGKLNLDRCLFDSNRIIDDYGAAVQGSFADTEIYIHNCTFTGNTGSSGAAVNTPGKLVVLNSTFADNLCSNGAKGHEVRIESEGLVHIFNSIFVEAEGTSGCSICVQNAANAMASDGRNLISSVGGNGSFTKSSLDTYGVTYRNVFGTNVLADNGGAYATIAPGTTAWNKATLEEVQSFAVANGVFYQVGIDQRGDSRATGSVFPGACELSVDSDTGEVTPVDPPAPEGGRKLYFKPGGTGDGSSWDSPLGAADLRSRLNGGIDGDLLQKGDTLLLAAGTYLCGTEANVSDQSLLKDHIKISSSVYILGGYPANVTGTEYKAGRNPAANETVFSGDLNGNDKADEGDCHLFHIDEAETVVFDGLVFENGYLYGTAANSYTVQVRPGVYVSGSTAMVYFNRCTFRGNYSVYTTTGVEAGGSCVTLVDGRAYFSHCTFKGNRASSRGAVLRIIGNNSPRLYCDACTFSDNGIEGQYGGVIMGSNNKGAIIAMNNCTFYKNYVGATGGQSGVAYNGNTPAYIINCTFADNMGTTDAKHYQIRTESDGGVIFNSVAVHDTDANTTEGSVDILVNKQTFNSFGYVHYGSFSSGASGTWNSAATDITGKTFQEVYASNVLSDNGGEVQTLKPAVAVTGAPLTELDAFRSAYSSIIPADWDLTVDARGEKRGTTTTAGAYEMK